MKTKIKSLLMDRLGYSSYEADMLADDLCKLHPELKPLFERWVCEGIECDSTVFHGYSIDTLRSGSKMNFIAALLTLDWLLREPEKALPIIRRGIK